MIEETGNTLEWITYHDEYSFDLIIEGDEYTVGLRIMCLDSDYMFSSSAMVCNSEKCCCEDEMSCEYTSTKATARKRATTYPLLFQSSPVCSPVKASTRFHVIRAPHPG